MSEQQVNLTQVGDDDLLDVFGVTATLAGMMPDSTFILILTGAQLLAITALDDDTAHDHLLQDDEEDVAQVTHSTAIPAPRPPAKASDGPTRLRRTKEETAANIPLDQIPDFRASGLTANEWAKRMGIAEEPEVDTLPPAPPADAVMPPQTARVLDQKAADVIEAEGGVTVEELNAIVQPIVAERGTNDKAKAFLVEAKGWFTTNGFQGISDVADKAPQLLPQVKKLLEGLAQKHGFAGQAPAEDDDGLI